MFNLQVLHQLKKIILLAFLLPFSFCRVQASDKNIVLLFADDVGIGDIPGFVDTPTIPLPNIDSLRLHGVTFKNAHATPWCSPSRYALLSGNYQFRGNYPAGPWHPWGKSAFSDGQETIAQLLEKNGYDTAMFGKWHLGGKIQHRLKESDTCEKTNSLTCKRNDWTKPLQYGPQDIGFSTSSVSLAGIQSQPYAYLTNGRMIVSEDDTMFYDEGSYERPQGTSIIKKSGEGDKSWDSSNYNMAIVRENERFLDDHAINNPTSSFFSFLSLGAIHAPHTPPHNFVDGTKVKGTHGSNELDVLYELDLVVGSVISSLKKRDLLNNTLVIFLSDNGGNMRNGNLKGGKGSIWEGGNVVPFIMQYGDQFPVGATRNQLVGITDIYATLAEFAGIEVPKNQAKDSSSLLKSIYDPSESVRENFSVFNYNYKELGANASYHDKYGQQPKEQSIRTARHKLIYNTKYNFVMMFDLVKDPSETNEICLQNIKTCKQLFKLLVKKGPCKLIQGNWCPGKCDDDHDFRYKNFNTLNCSWIASGKSTEEKIKKRCGFKAKYSPKKKKYLNNFPLNNPVRDYCRKTCGFCSSAGNIIPRIGPDRSNSNVAMLPFD